MRLAQFNKNISNRNISHLQCCGQAEVVDDLSQRKGETEGGHFPSVPRERNEERLLKYNSRKLKKHQTTAYWSYTKSYIWPTVRTQPHRPSIPRYSEGWKY